MNPFQSWFSFVEWNSIGPLLLDISIKATIVLLVAGALAAMLSRTSAAIRHRVWCLACCGLLVLPVLTISLPNLRIPILPAAVPAEALPRTSAPTSIRTPRRVAPDGAFSPPTGQVALRRDTKMNIMEEPFAVRPRGRHQSTESLSQRLKPSEKPAPQQSAGGSWWASMAASLWLTGAVLAALPLFSGFVANRRLRRASRPVEDAANLELLHSLRERLGLRRSLRLLETRRSIIPMTWGIIRPFVVFPAAWRGWTDSRRRLVLLHELAHVQRHDVAFQILVRLACALYWFHPLAWYALRRVRIERELACDDCVLMIGERPSEYAKQLLEIARAYQPVAVPTAVAAVQSTSLEQRIRALLDKARSHVPLGRMTAQVLFLCALFLVIGVAVVKPGRATDETETAAAKKDDINKPDENDASRPKTKDIKDSAESEKINLNGRVLDSDGKPYPQSIVWVQRPLAKEWTRIATTEKNGRFNASMDRTRFDAVLEESPDYKVRLAATAKGFGMAWARVEPAALEGLTLELAKEVPIEGRIVTLEGKPAVGVTMHITQMTVKEGQDVDKFIGIMPGAGGVSFSNPPLWLPGGAPGAESVVTDEAGRFRISGVGAENMVRLKVFGGGIGATQLEIVTLPAPPSAKPGGAISIKEGPAASVYYANFTHVAQPGRTLQGVVTDAKTGEPLGGVRVTAKGSWHSRENPVTTEEDGRYKITGVPKQEEYELLFEPQSSRHFNKELAIENPAGLDPVDANVSLRKGIIVRGRLTDRETGKPLGGTVVYNPLYPNENVLRFGERSSIANPAATEPVADDGTYEISVLPGPGAIAVVVSGEGYATASVDADRLREIIGEGPLRPHPNAYGEYRYLRTAAGPGTAGGMSLDSHQAAAIVNPPEDTRELKIDLTAIRGLSRRGTTEDEAGEPLEGVTVIGLGSSGSTVTRPPLKSAEFTVRGLVAGRKRTLLFVHHQRELGAKVVVTGDDTTPLTVRMNPTGTITGQFVEEHGDPLSDIGIIIELAPREPGVYGTGVWRTETGTDDEGRFQITGLIPGTTYSVRARQIQEPPVGAPVTSVRVEAGEKLDLGTYMRKDQDNYRRVSETSDELRRKKD